RIHHLRPPPPSELPLQPPEPNGEGRRGDDRETENERQDHRPHHHRRDEHDSEGQDGEHLGERISRRGEGIQAIAHVHASILAHSRAERSWPSIGRNTPSNQTVQPWATRSNCSIRCRTRPSARGVHVARIAMTCSGSTYSNVPSRCIAPPSRSPPVISITVP